MTSSSSCTNKTAGGAALRLATAALAALATGTNAAMYEVSPDGSPMTLTAALEVAGAGDIISLADGIYREPIVTMNAGVEGNPLVITGGRGAIINYFSGDRSLMWSQKVVDIRHSYVTLEGG
ncbi:EsV-1-164 [Ectocarpus siliculosus]|uniref:EsV-1-164 n=1 Tax=Ectocarpus siliculosus TaxID=2880 RepID=D8LJ28_ECTSI|nr:EsV-1-164 [Ectocarpus siliculosus]|eukprot:CBN76912.1 EsV-1-164 [Ectocarpus siliculosus]